MSKQLAILFRSFALLLLLLAAAPLIAQQSLRLSSTTISSADKLGDAPPPPILRRSPASILAGFVDAEAKLRAELNRYTFRRDVVLQTIGPNGEVTGEYIRNSQFVLGDQGNRIERVLYHPKPSIREMHITREDIQDLAEAQLLGVDVFEPQKYQLSFAGRELVAGHDTAVIDVAPRQKPDPHQMSQRFFVGRIWIDAGSSQIVKVRGVVEPQGKQRFPVFETVREQAGTPLRFPVRTEADDVLHFHDRDVHYRIKVRYYNYQRFASRVSISEISDTATN